MVRRTLTDPGQADGGAGMITVGADEREVILRIASSITSAQHDPIEVVRNSFPMLAWLEHATDEEDLVHRLEALNRMWCNLPDADDRGPVLDSPAEFVAGAEIFYLFATGDPEIPDGLTGGDAV